VRALIICAPRVSFSPLKQSARVKIIKFGAALGEVARVSSSVFVFTAALSARHTEHKKRFEKMGPTCLVSAAAAIERERDAAPAQQCAYRSLPLRLRRVGMLLRTDLLAPILTARRILRKTALFSAPQTICIQSHRFTQKIAPGIYDFPLEFVNPNWDRAFS
jgi:hypothetical protein